MARTPGSGWGAGPPTFQICPACGRKTLVYVQYSRDWSNGFDCYYRRRGKCDFNPAEKIDTSNLVRRRSYSLPFEEAKQVFG